MELGGGQCPCVQRPRTCPHPTPHPARPVSAPSPSLWPQEQKVMEKIVLLQEAAENYQIEPEEQFRAWFWALERLSEEER